MACLSSNREAFLDSDFRQICVWNVLTSRGKLPDEPRKIRQLIADLEKAGFVVVPGGKGSHHKFKHEQFPGSVILSGKKGDVAQHYQEKQVSNAIREATK